MIVIYRMIVPLLALILLPMLLLQAWKRGGYPGHWRNLVGSFPRLTPRRDGVIRLWIQAVSVGELLAVGPLLKRLQGSGNVEIVLTTTTATGLRVAIENYQDSAVYVGLFPLDLWPCSHRAWSRLGVDAALLVESELWPEHLRQAAARDVPVFLVNARLSERSCARHLRFRKLIRPLLQPLHSILAATASDRDRYASLNLGRPLQLTGNLKCDFDPGPVLDQEERKALLREFGFIADGDGDATSFPPVILGSSTWAGEEELLVKVFLALRGKQPNVRLLIVPRHVERRLEIDRALALLVSADPALRPRYRSENGNTSDPCFIYIGDTTGELRRFVQVASVVYVGRSMSPHTGGQSPIEAAAYGKPILFGPGMLNFKDTARQLLKAGAAQRVQSADELAAAITALLEDAGQSAQAGGAGKSWFDANRGAIDRTAEIVLAAAAKRP